MRRGEEQTNDVRLGDTEEEGNHDDDDANEEWYKANVIETAVVNANGIRPRLRRVHARASLNLISFGSMDSNLSTLGMKSMKSKY